MGLTIRRTGTTAIAVLALCVAWSLARAAEEAKARPDATVKLTGGSVAVGVGYTWGGGVLTYKGKDYKFKLSGLTTTAVGAGSIDASGEVYHLQKVADFAGDYSGVATAAAVGGGVGTSNFQNGNGVFLELHATGVGVLLKAGPSGIKITMEK